MVINLKQDTAFASHRAEVLLFEYLILLFSGLLLAIALMNFKIPKEDNSLFVYSCFMSSFEGKVTCNFPESVDVVGKGKEIMINEKIYSVPYASGKCNSTKIEFERGEIRCST